MAETAGMTAGTHFFLFSKDSGQRTVILPRIELRVRVLALVCSLGRCKLTLSPPSSSSFERETLMRFFCFSPPPPPSQPGRCVFISGGDDFF
jgi:hypothetical protein